jgi:hypothetical protein
VVQFYKQIIQFVLFIMAWTIKLMQKKKNTFELITKCWHVIKFIKIWYIGYFDNTTLGFGISRSYGCFHLVLDINHWCHHRLS